jgi:predicted membrane metal-binding protein
MSTALDPVSQAEAIRPGSDRNFGLVFGAVFAIVALWPLLGRDQPRWWALVLAAALVLIAFAKARLLRPLNYLWFRFGMLLARVVNPVVMGAVFFLCITPIALFMRGRNKDLLSLRWRRDDKTYWITREPAGPAPESMKNQF